MSFTLRKVACTAVLAVAASALTLPLAPAATAVGPVERMWTLADTDDDFAYGLFTKDLPGGGTAVVDEPTAASYSDLSASSDGSRVVYVRDTDTRTQVVVRDIGGTPPRVVRTVVDLASSNSLLFQPSLSPDGNTVAWTELTFQPFSIKIRRSTVGAGAASTVIAGYGLLGYLDNTTLLVQNTVDDVVKTIAVSGGALSTTSGIPQEAGQVTVSTDGTKVAWAEDTSTGTGADTAEIHVGSLANNAGTWTVTGDATLSSSLNNLEPAFSRDGATVYWVQNDGDGGLGEVLSRPFDASSPVTTVGATADDEIDVAITALPSADTTPPAAAGAAVPFTLNGSSATIRWTLPADTDVSGVIVSRAGRSPFYVPSPNVAVVDTGLTVGTTYTYTITAIDRSGNQATGVTRQLTAIKPGAVFGSPTSQYSTTSSFPVRFATGGNGSTQYFVQYLPYGGSWTYWVIGAAGTATRTFGAPASTNVNATTSIIGGTYTFSVRVVDEFGNSSAFTASDKAVVPFDQSKATFYGGGAAASSAAYLGSYKRMTTTAQYAKVTLVGNRLQVVGWKCSSCGSFAIYDGATKVGTVSTYSATLTPRVVVFTKTYATNGTHTFTIRPLGTAGHPGVVIDGLAMRR